VKKQASERAVIKLAWHLHLSHVYTYCTSKGKGELSL
jgi:hypothetical protein